MVTCNIIISLQDVVSENMYPLLPKIRKNCLLLSMSIRVTSNVQRRYIFRSQFDVITEIQGIASAAT